MYFLRTAFVQPTYSVRMRTVFIRCLYGVYTMSPRELFNIRKKFSLGLLFGLEFGCRGLEARS